jgi:hypothetical protein
MMRTLEELRTSQFHHELGQKMCAAFVAQQQGIALNTALKRISEPVGDLWLLLAELARQGWAEKTDSKCFSELMQASSKLLM